MLSFPLGRVGVPSTRSVTTTGTTLSASNLRQRWHSGFAMILPYLDQGNVYSRYDFNLRWNNPVNYAAVRTQIGVFQCPSTPGPRVDLSTDTAVVPSGASADYNLITRISADWYTFGTGVAAPTQPTALLGVIPRGRITNPEEGQSRIADITDGTSNTVMVAESAGAPYAYYAGKKKIPVNFLGNPAYPAITSSRYLAAGDGLVVVTGTSWADPDRAMGPNSTRQDGLGKAGTPAVVGSGGRPINGNNDAEFYSFHSGGSMFCLADGSVRFISENIDMKTMAALITRSGAELIGEF